MRDVLMHDDMMLAFFPDWNESFEFDCFIECDAVHVFFFCRVNGERSPKRAKQSHSSDVEEKCDQDYTHIRTRSCEYIGQLLLHRAHRKKRGDSILFLSFFFWWIAMPFAWFSALTIKQFKTNSHVYSHISHRLCCQFYLVGFVIVVFFVILEIRCSCD